MTDTPSQFPPSVPGSTESERVNGLRTLTHVLYGLYAVHWLTGGVTGLIAIIINYVKRGDTAGTPYADHFEWQIRTFWRALIAYVIGFALLFVGIGFLVLGAVWIWTLYRIIKGWLYLNDNKALDPQAWF
ncbi:hypothetical protein WK66_11120 [Burkholderia ubonensis]|uniref:DUF4870 family protein n=1 Tax=Burkholderia ubonensis TaxID=101571 RepID=UPI000752DA43|nr:hypothetical protein [Burkholderia ubonensis]KVO79511.1 hypothetical protein WJ80_01170 [Burkholderia ubonensis]KVR24600.1 hypothetical protein WK14_12865 [Burkholderia ubonensis]KVU26532.1 hypothetical protein WK66_11120 [Burkholderia ubonensis]KWD16036.1 hypothetical protein WL61_25270 [Burkholderia ubonensis]KWD22850.1 hypothetical protein WL62_15425 [Burkholderia ubonensis]